MLLHLYVIPWQWYFAILFAGGMLLGVSITWTTCEIRGALRDARWKAKVEVGVHMVLFAESDTWHLTLLEKVVQWSYCITVREFTTFLYEYTPGLGVG